MSRFVKGDRVYYSDNGGPGIFGSFRKLKATVVISYTYRSMVHIEFDDTTLIPRQMEVAEKSLTFIQEEKNMNNSCPVCKNTYKITEHPVHGKKEIWRDCLKCGKTAEALEKNSGALYEMKFQADWAAPYIPNIPIPVNTIGTPLIPRLTKAGNRLTKAGKMQATLKLLELLDHNILTSEDIMQAFDKDLYKYIQTTIDIPDRTIQESEENMETFKKTSLEEVMRAFNKTDEKP